MDTSWGRLRRGDEAWPASHPLLHVLMYVRAVRRVMPLGREPVTLLLDTSRDLRGGDGGGVGWGVWGRPWA